jgi:preprotein translocase subunit YajC
MQQVSMFTLAQEGINVAPSTGGAPAGAEGAAGTGTQVAGAAGATGQRPPQDVGGGSMMIPLFIMLGAMVIMMWMGSRRDKKKREETMNALKKGVKVHTVGGLIGKVVEVNDNEVVVESSGTRLTFLKSAISTVLDSGDSVKA